MNDLERFKKLRLIRKFLFDFLIDQNASFGIITTQQELAQDVHNLMHEVIKNDKKINSLYRSALRHLSQRKYNEVIA